VTSQSPGRVQKLGSTSSKDRLKQGSVELKFLAPCWDSLPMHETDSNRHNSDMTD
jgi:hypothetical protein